MIKANYISQDAIWLMLRQRHRVLLIVLELIIRAIWLALLPGYYSFKDCFMFFCSHYGRSIIVRLKLEYLILFIGHKNSLGRTQIKNGF